MGIFDGGFGGFLGDVVGGAGTIIGSGIGAAADAESQRLANEHNSIEASRNRDFQERMSNSAYQRAHEDMRKAGLNPMMAYSQGGASQPGGAQAHHESTRSGEVWRRSIASALEFKSLEKQFEEKDSQIALNKAAEEAKKSEVVLNNNSAKQVDANVKRLLIEMNAAKAEASYREKQAEWDKNSVKVDGWMNRIERGAGILGSLLNPIRAIKEGIKGGPVMTPTERKNWDNYKANQTRNKK